MEREILGKAGLVYVSVILINVLIDISMCFYCVSVSVILINPDYLNVL